MSFAVSAVGTAASESGSVALIADIAAISRSVVGSQRHAERAIDAVYAAVRVGAGQPYDYLWKNAYARVDEFLESLADVRLTAAAAAALTACRAFLAENNDLSLA